MKTKPIFFACLLAGGLLGACERGSNQQQAQGNQATDSAAVPKVAQATENWRPAFHYAPPEHWTNDPNGLVYYQGEYHLFFQHNPFDKVWGHMHWDHAVSKDLLHWENLPVAISEDTAMIFSGSVVVDPTNASGFCTSPDQSCLVAFYTAHRIRDPKNPDDYFQNQHVAFSNDRGRTWTKYAKNPVVDLGKKDFRDPDVFWHAPSQQWVMLVQLSQEKKTLFYGSKNLRDWAKLGEFGPEGNTSIIWECPELVELAVENEPGKKKWAFLLSSAGPYPGYQGMQYFVGKFDGKTFKNDNPKDQALYVEYGRDFFAAIGFNNLPDERKVLLGWASNWAYANHTPTHPWRNGMAVPRELALRKTQDGYRLVQRPVREVASLRKSLFSLANQAIGPAGLDLGPSASGSVLELVLEISAGDAKKFGVQVFKGPDEATVIGYDVAPQQLYIDRGKSGVVAIQDNVAKQPHLPSLDQAPLRLENGKLRLHLLLDRSMVEVFANDGQVAMTNLVFPKPQSTGVALFSEGGSAQLVKAEVWRLE
jgi:sucrose-6-phosphate hydrolase SacC (GH32 family)